MVAEGADIVDVGGESTRPGADPVPADEELRPGDPGGRGPGRRGPGVGRHHQGGGGRGGRRGRGHPGQRRVRLALAGGGPARRGMGGHAPAGDRRPPCSTTPATTTWWPRWRTAARPGRPGQPRPGWTRCGSIRASASARPSTTTSPCWRPRRAGGRRLPGLVGTSRKSFLGRWRAGRTGRPPPVEQRLPGSLATATWAMEQGAEMVRVHDVAATVQAATLVGAGPIGVLRW